MLAEFKAWVRQWPREEWENWPQNLPVWYNAQIKTHPKRVAIISFVAGVLVVQAVKLLAVCAALFILFWSIACSIAESSD